MSYNIRNISRSDGRFQWKNRKAKLVEKLQADNVDIMGLQEALFEQISYIDSLLPAYAWVGIGRDDGAQQGEFTPILYKKDKFELITWGAQWLSETPEIPSIGWDASRKRTVVWAILAEAERDNKILFINTHFDHNGKIAQINSSKQIVELTDSLLAAHGTMAVAVVGDFNVTAPDSALKPLVESFDYALTACESFQNTIAAATYTGFPGSGTKPIAIDHIFVRNATVNSYIVDTESYGLSDHRSVTALITDSPLMFGTASGGRR